MAQIIILLKTENGYLFSTQDGYLEFEISPYEAEAEVDEAFFNYSGNFFESTAEGGRPSIMTATEDDVPEGSNYFEILRHGQVKR